MPLLDAIHLRSILAATLAAAALFAVAAAPAGAWLRDPRSVEALSPRNSVSPKATGMRCQEGKRAIGTAPTIDNFFSGVALSKLWPGLGETAVVAAAETDPTPESWRLPSGAWCVTETGVAPSLATAASYVKDVTIVRHRTRPRFGERVYVDCPRRADRPVVHTSIGGGFEIVRGSNQVAAVQVEDLGARLSVQAHETDPTDASWELEAHVICANSHTAGLSGSRYAGGTPGGASVPLTTREGSSGLNSAPSKGAVAVCPAGQHVVGGGAAVFGAGKGEPRAPADVAMTMSRPGGTGATATTWVAIAAEVDPTAASWRLRARAVCTTLNGVGPVSPGCPGCEPPPPRLARPSRFSFTPLAGLRAPRAQP